MEHEERQFERNLTAEERHIDALLHDAMVVHIPEGLASRVISASQTYISKTSEVNLETQLDAACSIPTPEGLSQRVFDASRTELPIEQPAVIARINHSIVWRELALAACVVFAVFLAIQYGSIQNQNSERSSQPLIASNGVLSVEDEELLLEDLNLSEYAYLTDTRELAYADVAVGLESLRSDLELWHYGLLSD